jgi:hypothetical protein
MFAIPAIITKPSATAQVGKKDIGFMQDTGHITGDCIDRKFQKILGSDVSSDAC